MSTNKFQDLVGKSDSPSTNGIVAEPKNAEDHAANLAALEAMGAAAFAGEYKGHEQGTGRSMDA